MLRKMLKISGFSLLILVMLLFLIASPPRFLAPLIQPVRTLLVSVAAGMVSRSLHGTLEIDRVEGSFLNAPVARGISLKDAQGKQLVYLDTLSLRYRFADLVQGRLQIQELIIRRPQLWLAWNEQGHFNLTDVFSPASTDYKVVAAEVDARTSVVLEHVVVRDGSIDLVFPSLPGARNIDALSLDLSGELGENGLKLELQHGTAQVKPAGVTVETLQGALSIAAERVQFGTWLLKSDASEISLNGEIPGGSHPASLQLDLAPLDVGEIGRMLGEEALQGEIRGSVQAEGLADALELDGRFSTGVSEILISGVRKTQGSVPNYQGTVQLAKLDLSELVARDALRSDINAELQWRGVGLSQQNLVDELELVIGASRIGDVVIQPSEVSVSVESERVRVQRFELQTSAFSAVLGGEIDLGGPSALDYRVDLELEKLRKLIDVDVLGGKVKLRGQVGGSWPDTYVDGRLEASGIAFDDMGVKELDLRYRVDDLASSPMVTAKLDTRAARFGEVGIEAATGDVEYSFDGKEHRANFSTHIIQSAAMDTNLEGAFASDGQRSELTLQHIDTRLEDQVWHNTAPVQLTVTPDSFLLDSFRLVHDDAVIESSGSLLAGQFQGLVFRAGNIDLSLLSRITASPVLLSGRGDFTVNLNGTLEAPLLKADLTLRNEHGQSSPFERAGLNLSYGQARLEGAAYLEQGARRVLTAGVQLPVNLAFNGTPIDKRLIDAPLRVNLAIDRPSLEVLSNSITNLPPLTGTLLGGVDIAGSYTNLNFDSRINFEGVTVPDVIENIKGPFELTGIVETAQPPLALRKDLEEESLIVSLRSLEARSSRIGAEFPAGEAPRQLLVEDLVFAADGAWSSNRINGEVRNLHTRVALTGLPDTKLALAAARLSEERLEFEGVSVTTDASELRGAGDISLADQHLTFQWQLPRLELREFATELPREFPSLVSGRMNVKGTLQAPELNTRLEYAGSELIADIKLGLKDDALDYQADVLLSELELARFEPGMRGKFTTAVNIQGSGLSEHDREIRVKATIDSRDFNLAPELTGRLHADIIGQSLDVETLELQSTAFGMQAQGVLSGNQASDFRYHLTAQDLTSLQEYLPGDLQVHGKLDGKIYGDQGALNNVSTIKVEDWRYADWRGGKLDAALEIDDLLGSLQASANAEITNLRGPQLASSSLRFDGTYQSDQGEFELAVTQGPFTRSLLSGQLSTEQNLQITLEPFHLQQQDLGEINARISTLGPVLTGQARWTDQQKTLLTFDTRLDRSASNKITADMQVSDLDLSMLQVFSQEILHSDGQLNLDLALSGTLDQPQARGTLDVRDGELHLAALGSAYTGIQSQLLFNGTRVGIEQLQVVSETGVAELKGWIEGAGLALGQVDLKLSTDRFTVLDTPDMAAVISSDMALRGSGEALMASGNLDVVRARLRYEALPSNESLVVEPWELTVEGVFGAGKPVTADAGGEKPAQHSQRSLPFLRTDIQVNIPGNSWVQGDGTAVEIGGDINVRKALQSPFTATGELRTLRGSATFFGRRFTVEKGKIIFTGAEEIDPILNVEASHQVSRYTTYVLISGTASAPEVSFRSDPELPESDIISLLVFGRTTDQLSSSEQNSLGNQARIMAGRLAADTLESSVGEALGLDTIAIEIGDDTTATSMGVGRYISQDIFLFYQRTFRDPSRANRSGNVVGIEKRLNQRQTLKATGSDLGETSIDWLWRNDY